MGKVKEGPETRKNSKLNFADQASGAKGRAPPGGRGGEKKRKPRKLKSDAQKAKERAE